MLSIIYKLLNSVNIIGVFLSIIVRNILWIGLITYLVYNDWFSPTMPKHSPKPSSNRTLWVLIPWYLQ